jgi:hypothetical protein
MAGEIPRKSGAKGCRMEEWNRILRCKEENMFVNML